MTRVSRFPGSVSVGLSVRSILPFFLVPWVRDRGTLSPRIDLVLPCIPQPPRALPRPSEIRVCISVQHPLSTLCIFIIFARPSEKLSQTLRNFSQRDGLQADTRISIKLGLCFFRYYLRHLRYKHIFVMLMLTQYCFLFGIWTGSCYNSIKHVTPSS